MKVSLVCCTLGLRPGELRRFLDTIESGETAIQLIVVDQSPNGDAESLLTSVRDRFETVYLRSAPGLSRARNVGLERVDGDIVAFPDDDCWYSPDTVALVVDRFARDPLLAGVSGCWVDPAGRPSGHPWPTSGQQMMRSNAWRTAISFTLFFRTSAVRGFSFDPLVGVGSGTAIGSGEETLYLIELLDRGGRVFYDPSIRIHHPWKGVASTPFPKAYSYAIGFGYVATRASYPASFLIPRLAAPWLRLVGAAFRADLASGRYHLASGMGRFVGMVMGASGARPRVRAANGNGAPGTRGSV